MTTYNKTTALIVVDMQNDFAMPDGALYVKGGETLVEPIADEITEAARAGAAVIFTQDWHPAETPHFDTWPVHCVQNTPGARIVSDLPLLLGTAIIRKGTGTDDSYSAFYNGPSDKTGLDRLLALGGVTDLVVVGLAGDFCVKATAIDGAKLGYNVTVPLALTAFVNLTTTARDEAIIHMVNAGVKIAIPHNNQR